MHVGTAQAESTFWCEETVKKVCAAILFGNSKWEEQQDKNLISPQEVKLRWGICDVNTVWGPDSKSFKLFDINFIYGCIQA